MKFKKVNATRKVAKRGDNALGDNALIDLLHKAACAVAEGANKMKRFVSTSAGLILTYSLLGLSTGQANAACSGPVSPAKEHSSAAFVPAVFNTGLATANLVTLSGYRFERRPIVGLWEFEVRLNGAQNGLPDKALFDWGLATWHEDGTEIQFSAGRSPSSGDVCMGVWRQTGKQFILHHVALGLTPPTAAGTFVGPAIIRAAVTVDGDEDSYTGPYTLSMYPGSPNNGTEFNESGKPLVTFIGTVKAKRVREL
jgi:hypothetical protein